MHSIFTILLATTALVCALPQAGHLNHRHVHNKRTVPSTIETRNDLIPAKGLTIAYTPFTDALKQTCKQQQDITNDIQTIASKGFSTVRIYGTNCRQHDYVGAAAKAHGLKVILGIDIGIASQGNGIGSNYVNGQISDITSCYKSNGWWDIVSLVVYGNEAIFHGYTSASVLADAIRSAKASFQRAGYSGKFTTTEPMNIVAANKNILCPVMDIISANIHPFFNPQTSAASAGAFVASSLKELATYCGGNKDVINLETGWPSGPASSANPSSGPVPGVDQQKQAIKSIVSSAGDKCVLLSWTNDMWKSPGEEQFWGVKNLFS